MQDQNTIARNWRASLNGPPAWRITYDQSPRTR